MCCYTHNEKKDRAKLEDISAILKDCSLFVTSLNSHGQTLVERGFKTIVDVQDNGKGLHAYD